jgi:putative FmdB family regulatory protein
MPIYEYRCATCGFQSEYLRKVSDPELSVCPECGKASFRKLVTAAGFQLKGSGWYATDFKGGAKPGVNKENGGSKPAENGGSKSAESGADSTPASETKAAACGAGACPACT